MRKAALVEGRFIRQGAELDDAGCMHGRRKQGARLYKHSELNNARVHYQHTRLSNRMSVRLIL